MLLRTQQLDQASLKALKSLLSICQKEDGYTIPVYPHLLAKHRSGPASLLYYDEDRLVAFLAVFHFHADACEIALLVDPAHRQQGLAKALWSIMLSSIHTLRPLPQHLIISTPNHCNQTALKQHGFSFEHSEYDMENVNKTPRTPRHTSLTIRPAEYADLKELCLIDKACFHANRQHPEHRFTCALDNPNIHIFIAEHEKHIIGQVHLTFEETQVRLTDLAVLPTWQKQGFGHMLIDHSLNYAYNHNQYRVILVVAAHNKHALKLYQNLGFKIYNAVDYYKLDLTNFKQNL